MTVTRKVPPQPQTIKALALDLDGTVLRPGAVLSGRTAAALRACAERGTGVIFCTGRSPVSAEQYRRIIAMPGPMVCFNGAEVVDMPGGAILGQTLLEREAAEYCVDLSRRMDVYCQVYFPRDSGKGWEILMAERDCAEAAMYRNHTGMDIVIGNLKTALAAPDIQGCIKAMFLAEPPVLERLRPLLEERFQGGAYITQTQPAFLEVMAPGVSKGAGLRLALERLGLRSGEVIAFGDEENDLPMFALAGYSAAPANAKETVLAAADIVIPSNTDDGVAAFLEDFFSLCFK